MTVVTGDGDDAPMTFAAYAVRIGKSRPYVSKLVAEGRITAASLTPERLIIPHLADADRAANADPARGRAPQLELHGHDAETTYARQRARKTAADAELAEIELKTRKGELIARASISATLSPAVRELRDAILAAPRDTVLDPVQAADCEAALVEALAAFSGQLHTRISETRQHEGGAAA